MRRDAPKHLPYHAVVCVHAPICKIIILENIYQNKTCWTKSVCTDRRRPAISITPPILPPSPPTFLPETTIEFLRPQLPIDSIMRFAHPRPEVRTSRKPWFVAPVRLVHPRSKVIRTDPTRIQAREEFQKRAHFQLLFRRGSRRIGSRQGVEEGPG